MPPFNKKAEQSKQDMLKQWGEPQLLPVGMAEFEVWSDRIIKATLLPADPEGMKFALASMILHNLGPTDSAMPDGYFINYLRKSAANQVAHQRMLEIKEAREARVVNETV